MFTPFHFSSFIRTSFFYTAFHHEALYYVHSPNLYESGTPLSILHNLQAELSALSKRWEI